MPCAYDHQAPYSCKTCADSVRLETTTADERVQAPSIAISDQNYRLVTCHTPRLLDDPHPVQQTPIDSRYVSGPTSSSAYATEATGDDMDHDNHREYRFAVVFYGGVSLAVYENGVARAFYDAVQQRGLFKPLATLLGGRFVVDVISGASAGGINGLLLAAALESGADFGKTADLWRQHGGLQELLKPLSDAPGSQSLLSHEYYLDQLRAAFRHVCTPVEQALDLEVGPKEIDVFVTGTDLNGQRSKFKDAINSEIELKNHALVFHLKHRRGRTRLGVKPSRELSDAEQLELQVDTLACVARITSSFPGAFPPFTLAELSEPKKLHADTEAALQHLSSRTQPAPLAKEYSLKDHHLIDGGVLENSPFGPVLESIFHRMPSDDAVAVERTLFYVEPDPKIKYHEGGFTPVQVALNAVLTLPSYDGIAEDLRRLLAHNDAVRRASALRGLVSEQLKRGDAQLGASNQDNPAYRAALLNSIACLLLGVAPSEIHSVRNLSDVAHVLSQEESLRELVALRELDASFHLRRAFYVLYEFQPTMTTMVGAEAKGLAMEQRHAITRVVKALKLLRDVWLSSIARKRPGAALEETRPAKGEPTPAFKAEVKNRLNLLQRFMFGEWFEAGGATDMVGKAGLSALEALMASPGDGVAPISRNGRFARDVAEQLLDQKRLQTLRDRAMAWLEKEAVVNSGPQPNGTRPRVLDALDKVLCELAPEATSEFHQIDACVFPSELAASMYELDEVALTRISPRDPLLPDPKRIAGDEKVTGDLLAHFSAFFRRDWRTNDIAWGRSDALHQILRVVLKPEIFTRAMTELDNAAESRARKEFVDAGAGKPVLDAFDNLMKARTDGKLLEVFTRQVIMSAQESAMQDYVKVLQEDRKDQDKIFNWASPPLAREAPTAVESFVTWKLGASSPFKELPMSLLAEQVGQAGLLLSHMVAPTLEGTKVAAPAAKVGRVVRPVLWFVHSLGRTSRSEANLTFTLMFGLVLAGLGFAVAGIVSGAWHFALLGVLGALLITTIAYLFSVRRRLALVLTLVVSFLVSVLVVLCIYFTPALRQWAGSRLIATGLEMGGKPKVGSTKRPEPKAQLRQPKRAVPHVTGDPAPPRAQPRRHKKE
jgi:patatin-related protein